MVSEVWPELSKEPLFCGFCQKALFEERDIYYSAITIIISKQTAIYTELYFISYSTYISNKLGMFFLTTLNSFYKILWPLLLAGDDCRN